ncbi:rhodanese-like domain-containing protein [Cryobacterium melibiosiphilum]|uniref:Rhodanese-like domain-containing protein n=1 Tax=Cryobacterium melibiosiphilum TaxID=995039 RepID=A0A3A5MR47_9MICO|nr:rhodanese-like domain-containing protein [Cryobacterium melibiosiphilum]RJT89648.1 rhodanese-like domain-containing protein [Cryobacterium melibiosiphilum]
MKRLIASVVLVLAAFVLTGCAVADSGPVAGSSPTATAGAVTPTPTAEPAGLVVLDVRTPEEYAAGHLAGALNIDVKAADFDWLVSALPLDGEYVVHCQGGGRAATAVTRLAEFGFTDVTDAGSFDNATALTGLAVVTETPGAADIPAVGSDTPTAGCAETPAVE